MKVVLINLAVCVFLILFGCVVLTFAQDTPEPQTEANGQQFFNNQTQRMRRGFRGERRMGFGREGVAVTEFIEDSTGRWRVHDMNRPAPPVVNPGQMGNQDQAGSAPSDAIVLFDGTDLSNWTSERGGQAGWIVRDGYTESVEGSGSILTEQSFGSCQLHLEFATPERITGSGQDRGNSGVYLMSTYEVQILDSYENPTYPDGMCAALYGRNIPLVNACRKPGQWQSFDIIFHRPVFEGDEVVKKATFTVFHNGLLVHDHVELQGGTEWMGPRLITEYAPHADKLPIMLQDHDNPVRFRNIWIRELED